MASLLYNELSITIARELVEPLFKVFPESTWSYNPITEELHLPYSTSTQAALEAAVAGLSSSTIALDTVKKNAIASLRYQFDVMCATHGVADPVGVDPSVRLPVNLQTLSQLQVCGTADIACYLRQVSGEVLKYEVGETPTALADYMDAWTFLWNLVGERELLILAASDEAAVSTSLSDAIDLIYV